MLYGTVTDNKRNTFNVNSRTWCIHYVRVVVEHFVLRSAHADGGHSASGRLQQVFVIVIILIIYQVGQKRFILISKVR